MTPIFLDCEVVQHDPPDWAVRGPEHFSAPKNYKDPQKIQEYIAQRVQEQVADLRARSSLTPDGPLLGGTVAAVGVAVGPAALPWVGTAATGDEAGERDLLALLEAGLTARSPADHVLITFGGDRYDTPFLAKRALRHGLYALAGWLREVRHADIRRVWEWGDRQALGRLTDIARWLGIPVQDAVRGSGVQALWESGRTSEVGAHCGSDVTLLREVWRRFAAAGWAPGGEAGEAGEVPVVGVPPAAPAVPSPVAPAAPSPERRALESAIVDLELGLDDAVVEAARRSLGIGARVPLGNLAEPDLLTRYREALEASPAPLVVPSGIHTPPVLEGLHALYHRAVGAGWDPRPFEQGDSPMLQDRWLAAALLYLGTPLRHAYTTWTGQKAPGFCSTLQWHEELRAAVREAQAAAASDDTAWVAPTPVPAEATTWVMAEDGFVACGKRADADTPGAVCGRVLVPPAKTEAA